MEQYLHLFGTKEEHDAVYNGQGYGEPWTALIDATDEVTYNKFIDYKNTPGSIIYHDGNKLKFTSKEKWDSSLGTPVAVVVIPASHMSDGKCRGMSLCNMSYKTPQTGTLGTGNNNAATNGTNLMWGVYGTDVDSMTNYTAVKTTSGTNNTGYLPSDLFDGGYYSGASDMEKCVSPYNDDGSQNPEYLTAGQALADMDGKANTEVLVSLSAIKDTYSSGAFANDAANYPAAFACHLFSTLGTVQSQWYLPSIGELGYLYTKVKTINESLSALGNSSVRFGDLTTDITSLGYWCWSSSEYNTNTAWSLFLNGSVNTNDKNPNNSTIRVRAFAAFDI